LSVATVAVRHLKKSENNCCNECNPCYISTMTANMKDLLAKLNENPCADSDPAEDWAWTSDVLKSESDKATFGHLMAAGLVKSDGEAYMITAEGVAAL